MPIYLGRLQYFTNLLTWIGAIWTHMGHLGMISLIHQYSQGSVAWYRWYPQKKWICHQLMSVIKLRWGLQKNMAVSFLFASCQIQNVSIQEEAAQRKGFCWLISGLETNNHNLPQKLHVRVQAAMLLVPNKVSKKKMCVSTIFQNKSHTCENTFWQFNIAMENHRFQY